MPRAGYVHIPFCRRRCFYCDFAIAVVGDHRWGEDSPAIGHYITALTAEIESTAARGVALDTVFLGGGTPSLLSVAQLDKILMTLDRHLGLAGDAEISMEIDPGTFDREKLRGFLDLGVNRISLGVQAFEDELLQLCGRSHGVQEVERAIDLLWQTGVKNWSLDLISGLPHQTQQQWEHTLERVVAIAPPHISVYDLIVEPKTVFSRRYQPGEAPLPSDDLSANLYRLTGLFLGRSSYQHYEISNYAQPGYQCRHNRVYWHNQPYYGWGMGATSYLDNVRFTRPRTRQKYYEWLQSGQPIDTFPTSSTEQFIETVMLGLRLAEGLPLEQVRDQFSEDYFAKISPYWYPYYQQGWIQIRIPDNQPWLPGNPLPSQGQIALSDPEGFLFSNRILAEMFRVFPPEESSDS